MKARIKRPNGARFDVVVTVLHALMSSALFVTVSLIASCGYSTESRLPSGVRRVAVDVFANDTFYREIEFQLTRELTTELNHRSAYVVSRRSSADAVLTGRILSVKRPTIIENENDLVSEQAVIVTAEVTLTRLSDGQVLEQFVLSNRAEFIVERGETLESAFDESLKDLAEDIINQLERRTFLEGLRSIDVETPTPENSETSASRPSGN